MIAEIYAQLRSLLMNIAAIYVLAFVGGAILIVLGFFLSAEVLKYHGPHVVMCPQTHSPALVKIDVLHAVFARLIGERDLRLKNCSRWSASQGCARECLKTWR